MNTADFNISFYNLSAGVLFHGYFFYNHIYYLLLETDLLDKITKYIENSIFCQPQTRSNVDDWAPKGEKFELTD